MRTLMRFLSNLFMVLSALCFAVPAFAQGGASLSPKTWVAIGAGFAMAIASAGCAIGQGKVAASAAEGIARNPSARTGINLALFLGLALIESLALYTLVIIIYAFTQAK
jgi:F-type H+-transporting ATPase subunit c